MKQSVEDFAKYLYLLRVNNAQVLLDAIQDGVIRKRNRIQLLLKVAGYRALSFKTRGTVHLRSCNNKDFSLRYPTVANAPAGLPNETIVD